MPGLDRTILNALNHRRIIDRIKLDVRSDFILAPHYDAVYVDADNELWSRVSELLRSGNYQPSLPNTMNIPKERGFTRPGSILNPLDRFVYQALLDAVEPTIEANLDRDRSFSHVPATDGMGLFEPAHESWEKFQDKLADMCANTGYIVKGDIANYFERIPQHHIINLLGSAGCEPSVVNLIEEILLAFQERDSFGIIQGVYGSDVLGNFYLSDFDAYCELEQIDSARYVDDIYLYFPSEHEAKKGLINLIQRLRSNGLHLNEFKSGIHTTKSVLREESEVDEMFDAARDEIREAMLDAATGGYGFTADWDWEEPDAEEVNLTAVQALFLHAQNIPEQSDKIERFCLPVLRSAGSDIAIEQVLLSLVDKPHMTRIYHSYLSGFVAENDDLVEQLETIIEQVDLITDYQRMYILAALYNASEIQRRIVNRILKWASNRSISLETRAFAAIFCAKHGRPQQKRAIRTMYENEPSEYVRSAILYASKFFTPTEKRTCKRAWGGHNLINTLIATTL